MSKYKIIEWNDIVDESNGKKRKDGIKLSIYCIYKNRSYQQNYSNDVFPILIPKVGNSGGFRISGTRSNNDIKYVALSSTNKDPYWQDS